MANGSQISTSVTIINSLLGFQAISLSNMNTSAATVITAGSKVEIASAFFTFSSDDTPQASTWTAIATGGNAYITLTPSGTAGSQVVTSKWSSTAPEWSDSKQGWYASAASSIRVIGGCYKTGATQYDKKFLFNYGETIATPAQITMTTGTVLQTSLVSKIYEIGSWDMATSTTLTIAHGLGNTGWKNIRNMTILISDDAAASLYQLTYAGYAEINTINFLLNRDTSGFFDSVAFNDTAINRGWIYFNQENF